MEWANSAALRSVAATHMYQDATKLFEMSCSIRSRSLSAQDRRWTQRIGHAAPPEQLLRLALEGMVAAQHLLARTNKDAAAATGACSSAQQAAGERLAAELSAPAAVPPSSGLIRDAASCGLARSVHMAAALAPGAAAVIPQVMTRRDAFSELCLGLGRADL